MIPGQNRWPLRPRCRVFRLGVCDLLPDGLGPRDGFERVWETLPVPARSRQQSFTFVGDLFVKGASSRLGRSVRRWWRAARIRSEVRGLLRMRARGAPVPEVVAWGKETVLGLAIRAFVIERRLDGTVTLSDFMQSGPAPDLRRDVLERVSRTVTDLHRARIFHRDLALRNLLVRVGDGEPEITFIDCPRAERGWLPIRTGFLRRADALRVARGLVRLGVDREDVGRALPDLRGRETERILEFAHRAPGVDPRRTVRGALFIWFGL